MQQVQFILYVRDQNTSMRFYSRLLRLEPTLHVPGMTEFTLADNCKLGLMPESGIAKIVHPALPHPSSGNGIPRCELYLMCENADEAFRHAQACGAVVVSPPENRDWGHRVSYTADADGHILAFAEVLD